MLDTYLNNKFFTLYFFPFLLGSLSVFSFQPFNFSIINFFIMPFFFYLLIFIKKKSKGTYIVRPYKKNFFIFGTSFGFGFYLAGIHWINHSLTFDENFKILIPFGLIIIPLFLSLFFSVISTVIGPLLNLDLKSIFFLSGSLAFSDYVRAKIFTGFPWNLWAYSFSWSSELIQPVQNLGLFSFNLLCITIFMLPALIFLNIKFINKFVSLIVIVLILLTFYIYGSYKINKNKLFLNSVNETFNVKVISPNFSLEYGLPFQKIEERISKLIRYSEPDSRTKTLFVWPEGVFSGYSFREIEKLKKTFSNNFGANHFILFGVNKYDKDENGPFNSLLIVNNKMEIINEYKKQKLVPFGEFLPFEKIFKKFGLKKITEGYGSFVSGRSQKNLILENLNILPLICYEIIFSEFVQNSDADTNLIINISEDGWFGNSLGPHQHFAKGIFRAIEQNSFLLRSANKGITAIIDNKGLIIKKLNLNEAGNIEIDVPLIKSSKRNKNDLIFFTLLITYILFFIFYKKNNDKK